MSDERKKPKVKIRSYVTGDLIGITVDPTVTKEEEEERIARLCGITVEELKRKRQESERKQQ